MGLAIGFIGAGNMAEALIKGLVRNQEKEKIEIRVTNRTNTERLKKLAAEYGILAARLEEIVNTSQVIVLAAKPKDIKGILQNLISYDLKHKLVISLAAGIPICFIQNYLPQIGIVRAMPNTSSAVLHSMTGLVRGNYVTDEQRKWAEKIFQGIGKYLWIDETEMNGLIALSGSAPAYYYLFTEYLIEAGIELGLSREMAEMLARETLIGAGKMLEQSDKSPGKLREEITSPNGTTFAALEVFRSEGLKDILQAAVNACVRRAEEMEREYGQ